MIEYTYDGTLEGLFTVLDRICRSPDPESVLPDHIHGPLRRGWKTQPTETAIPGGTGPSPAQPELFDGGTETASGKVPSGGIAYLPSAVPSAETINSGSPPDTPAAQYLYGLSVNAYDCFIHGWMSEFPIEAELIRFAWKVLDAGRNAAGGLKSAEGRREAEIIAADRGDPDVQTVLDAAQKVWKELDRLRGLLRFSPGAYGIYVARCTPDHFVLPGLAGHFTQRFGETPWGIIDERRTLALVRFPGEDARLIPPENSSHSIAVPNHDVSGKNDPWDQPLTDPWENLWRNYHRVINNERRSNPQLQRQFMPKRYWKYLPELRE